MSINLQTQQKLTLDFQQKTYKTVIAKQYDKGSRFIPIECTDNGKAVLLDSSFDVHVKVLTPDNRALLNTVPVQENGTLLLELTETMLSCPGKATVEIIIYDVPNSKRLSAMNFYLLIEPGAYADERILSSDEFNALTELLEKADSDYTYIITAARESADAAKESSDAAKISETNAKTSEINAKTSETNTALSESNAASSAAVSENSVKLSESWAVGGTNSRTDEDTDNSKYYAVLSSTSAANSQNCMEQAAISATDAKTSESNAGNSAANAASSETNAKTSEINSKTSETNAKNSEINAANSDSSASASAITASAKAEEAAENAVIASSKAEESANSAKYANDQAILTESYFHGGTGTREGEDEDCVTAYYEKIKAVADIDIANTNKAGLVRASDDVNVGIDGSMSIPKLAELENIMKGASSGFVTDTVQSMVTTLNDASLADYKVGTNILIKAVGVPDFWISEIYSEKITYTYTDDNNLIEQVNLNGGTLQTGYYGISFLETDKVDLTGIAKETYVDEKFDEAVQYSDTVLNTAEQYTDRQLSSAANNQQPTFSQAASRENIVSGERMSAILGKIKKWFSDLKTVAFTGSYNDLTNKPVIPASLPANGGNADTVDNKHASDFVPNTGRIADRILVTDGNGNVQDGGLIKASELIHLQGIQENIQNAFNQVRGLPHGLISVLKTDWTTPPGNNGITNYVRAFVGDSNPYVVDLGAGYKLNGQDIWPGVRVSRAYGDEAGNNIIQTYATKAELSNTGGVTTYHTTGSATVNANGDTDTTVYFGVTYVRPPAFSFAINSYGGGFHDYLVFTKEVTTTYAVVRFYRRTGSQKANMTFQWSAVGIDR